MFLFLLFELHDWKRYLGEIDAKFQNISACLSGAKMGSNHEKEIKFCLWGNTEAQHL